MNTGIENLAWGLARCGWNVHVLAGGAAPVGHGYDVPESVIYHFTGKPGMPEPHCAAFLELCQQNSFAAVIGWVRFLLPIAAAAETLTMQTVFIVNEGAVRDRSARRQGLRGLLRRFRAAMMPPRQAVDKNWALSRITCFVAISSAVVDNLSEIYGISPDDLKVIGRGVDTELFAPLVDFDSTRDGPFRVLYTGNIIPAKGLGTVAAALAQCGAPVELRLCGIDKEHYVAQLRSMLPSDGPHRIVFRDRLSTEDVRAELQAAHAFVFPSRSEGLGKSLLEAMAVGLPCVISDLPAFKDVVRDGTDALVVPVDDADAMAHALERLIADPGLRQRLGRAARERILESFSQAAEIAAWDALLQRNLKTEWS